jgi:hypothetical protein
MTTLIYFRMSKYFRRHLREVPVFVLRLSVAWPSRNITTSPGRFAALKKTWSRNHVPAFKNNLRGSRIPGLESESCYQVTHEHGVFHIGGVK